MKEEQTEETIGETRDFYDEESNSFDGKHLKSTELPFKKRTGVPQYADEITEAKMTLCKSEIGEIIKDYEKDPKARNKNLNQSQAAGLRSLKSKIKNKDIVCFPTDKSGVMTAEHYVASMAPHLEGTIPVTEEDYAESEKLLNAHMQVWSRIMKLSTRVSSDFQAENNEIPPLHGLRKDHKPIPLLRFSLNDYILLIMLVLNPEPQTINRMQSCARLNLQGFRKAIKILYGKIKNSNLFLHLCTDCLV